MRPGETVRFACEECQIVFDLHIAPMAEWVEHLTRTTTTARWRLIRRSGVRFAA
jgi:hypothetical protein